MKTQSKTLLVVALLLANTQFDLHAQLPNAWQINDISGGSGSLLSYYTNLTGAQFNAATNSGWQFGATCRMVNNYGFVGNGSIYLLFGDGTHRYGFNLNLNASGQLVANPLVGSTIVLTPNATTATNYHRHEMDFDPATQQVTYSFDGVPLANWSPQSINANKAEPNWGSSSSADRGVVDFHHVQFAVTGQGVVARYDAGYAGQPAVAPSPTTQGWGRRPGAIAVSETPVSPDPFASPLVTTLPATALTPNAATLNASLSLYILPTECYFEYGLTTNYGAFTATNVIAAGGFTANVSEGIGGLQSGTAYHFRAVAGNSAGLFAGPDLTLTTLAFTVVTNLADDGPGTLRSAVALANANPSGAAIRFDPTLSGQTIVLTSGELVLSNHTDIAAASLTEGIAISGDHNYRIFEIGTNADVLLDSLTLRDGLAPNAAYPAYRGGAILNYGQLTLDNCTLQDNQSVSGDGPAGGGIENYNGTLVISNSLFMGNSVGGPGSNPGSGGGIFNEEGTINIDHSVFSSNTPAAIFNSGPLRIYNSTFSNNSAPRDDGGAIYNSFGSVVLANVTLAGNSAYDGGAIFNEAQLTLNNCTLAGNIASGGPGGGIWSYDDSLGTVLILNNTIVAGNTAPFDPDILGAYSGTDNLVGVDPLLAPLGDYGGLTPTMPPLPGSPAIDNGHDSVTNFLVTDQRGYPRLSGLHVDIGAVESTNPPAAPIVVTLPASGQTPTTATLNASVAPNGAVTTSYFEYGLTTAYGSGTATNVLSAGAANISAALTNLSPATYYHCRAVATNSLGTTYGNDVVFHTGGITNIVLNATDNGPGSLRQAILYSVQGDYPVLFTNTLSGQTILLTNGPIVVSNDVAVDGSPLASPVHIDGNQNSRVFLVTNATVTLNSLIITHGFETSHDGGGIENYGTLTLNHSIVVNNSATNGGGGGIGNFGRLTLNHSIVANNSATNLASGYGGGIFNKGALFLNDSAVTNNSALAGIGIYTDGSATLNHSTVAYNAAPIGAGGGIYNEQSGTLTLNNSTVADNSAPGYYAGGILTLGTSMLNNSTVAHNSALGGLGGGIAVGSTGTLLLNDCTVASNSATNGGGIYNAGGTVRLTNSIVSANAADTANNIAGGYSGVSNLVNTANINLAPLGHYGGPTQTMPPLYGSPAIDAGDDTSVSGFAYDQRGPGFPRLSGDHVDIGAVEAQVASAGNPPLLMNSVWSSGGGSGATFQFSFTNSANIDFTALTSTNVALPLTDWTILGNAIQVTPGVYQCTDPGATNGPQRFYRVVSP